MIVTEDHLRELIHEFEGLARSVERAVELLADDDLSRETIREWLHKDLEHYRSLVAEMR